MNREMSMAHDEVFQGYQLERNPDEFIGKTVTLAGKDAIRWERVTVSGVTREGDLILRGGYVVTGVFRQEPDRIPLTDKDPLSRVAGYDIARGVIHHPEPE